MRKLMVTGSFILLAVCSSEGMAAQNANASLPTLANETQTVSAFASYPFPLVKWNGHVYAITQTQVTEIAEEVGEITLQSSACMPDSPNNFSTTFPAGSKLYSIQGIATDEAIAVRTSEDEYIKVIMPHRE